MKCGNRCRVVLKRNLLLFLTLIGVVLGLSVGFALRPANLSEDALMWTGLPGKLYLRLLKMMIVPLIVASMITGTANLEPKSNGKISLVTIVYVFVTNMIGAILGILVFVIFRPGVRDTSYAGEQVKTEVLETQDIFADLIRNIFPDNLIESTFRQTQTTYEWNATYVLGKVKIVGKHEGTNFLGLVFACTVIGMGAAVVGKKAKPLVNLCEAVTQTVVVIIQWFMWTTPIGVFSLIVVAVADIQDIGNLMKQVGIFVAAVTTGLVVQQLIVLNGIFFAITRKNPFTFLLSVAKPWLIAFASGATVVAMPEMLTICENKLKNDRRVARFVIPLTVTISANGSAVFISCSCLFIASLTGKTITAADYVTIGILVAVSAMAIPSVPSASIVTIVMILSSLNIPIEALALLLAVEFFLDRLRTTSSVLSDIICVVVTERLCRKDLEAKPDNDELDTCKYELEVNGITCRKEELYPLRENVV